jgi:hypothetical protein
MQKDVHLIFEDKTFFVQYQTEKAKNCLALTKNTLDDVNFPLAALPVIKKHLKRNKISFGEFQKQA